MSRDKIKESIGRAIRYLNEHLDEARYTDLPVKATLEEGLKCRVEGKGGIEVVTDMPTAVGGGASAPSPGWQLRAALACCDATLIGMRAAQEGVNLTSLEVTVDSESDDRGLLGIDDSIPAGPLRMRTRVRLQAPGIDHELLQEIVSWAEAHSPVADAIHRSVPSTIEVETV